MQGFLCALLQLPAHRDVAAEVDRSHDVALLVTDGGPTQVDAQLTSAQVAHHELHSRRVGEYLSAQHTRGGPLRKRQRLPLHIALRDERAALFQRESRVAGEVVESKQITRGPVHAANMAVFIVHEEAITDGLENRLELLRAMTILFGLTHLLLGLLSLCPVPLFSAVSIHVPLSHEVVVILAVKSVPPNSERPLRRCEQAGLSSSFSFTQTVKESTQRPSLIAASTLTFFSASTMKENIPLLRRTVLFYNMT